MPELAESELEIGTAPAGVDPVKGLAAKATSAFGWNIAGFTVRTMASFGVNLLLARLLGPKPFGLVAMAMTIIAFGSLLMDSGLGVQLIRKREVTTAEIRTAFTLQVLLGIALAIGLFFLAPVIARELRQETVQPILRALAVVLFIKSSSQTATALLKRDLKFKLLQKTEIASYLIGYGVVGTSLALAGSGVWSLVTAQLTQSVLYAVVTWTLARHSLALHIGPEVRELLRFGSQVLAANVVSWAIGALPTLLIGRELGVLSLGLYNRAFMMVGVPLTVLASSLQAVALSLYSRLNNDRAIVTKAFLAVVSLVSLLAFPCFLFAAASANPFIEMMLGKSWLAAAPLMFPLALAMPFDAFASLGSSLLISQGKPNFDLWTQAITVLSGAMVLSAGIHSGSLSAVAWKVFVGVYMVRATIAILFVKRVLRFRWSDLGRAVRGGLIVGAGAFLAAYFIQVQAASVSVPAMVQIAVALAGAVVAVLVLSRIFRPRLVSSELLWLARDVTLPVPAFFRWLLSSTSTVEISVET